jgi:orotate phosphoribosyltransferase
MTAPATPSGPDAETAATARRTARILLECRAVNFRPDEPYTLASGTVAPTYIDCRRLLSFPRARAALMDDMARMILARIGYESLDCVAGGETAGIPFAALIAERLGLPMAYVRKKPKGYGRNARIEGVVNPGDRVLLVEDLATDGGSKLSFVEALRETGADCRHTAVLFFYGIFPEALPALDAAGIRLHALATWADVLAEARAGDWFEPATLTEVEAFLTAPRDWSRARGGA